MPVPNTSYFRPSKQAEIVRTLQKRVTGGLVRSLERDERKANFISELGFTTSNPRIRSNAITALEKSLQFGLADKVRHRKLGAPIMEEKAKEVSVLPATPVSRLEKAPNHFCPDCDDNRRLLGEQLAFQGFNISPDSVGDVASELFKSQLSASEKLSISGKLRGADPVEAIFGADWTSKIGSHDAKIIQIMVYIESSMSSKSQKVSFNASSVLANMNWGNGGWL